MKLGTIIKGTLLGVLWLCGIVELQAQSDPQYTHYMYNTINVNPAYAGSRGVMNVFGLHRTQWVGLDGAPSTTAFSLNTPLGESRLGLGVSFVNDNIGAMNENNISIDISYTIDLDRELKLAFGLKGTGNLMKVDYDKLNIHHTNDASFRVNIANQFSPNIGAGLYLYSQTTYVGLSVPNFLETDRYDDNVYATMKQKMNFYLIGGHVFELSPTLKFKPAFLARGVSGAPIEVDISTNFMIADKFMIGAAYRWNAAVSGLIGFQVTDGLFVGYSYDAETTKLSHYNSGSHELFLRFEWINRYKRITSPRFF